MLNLRNYQKKVLDWPLIDVDSYSLLSVKKSLCTIFSGTPCMILLLLLLYDTIVSKSVNYGICDVYAGFSTTAGMDGVQRWPALTLYYQSPASVPLVSLTPGMRVFGRLLAVNARQ